MTNDEDFGRELRGLAGRVGPAVQVDTSGVIARARRRRAATWTGGGATLAVGAVAVALVGASLPWSSGAHGATPAGPGVTGDPTSPATATSTTVAATPGPTAAPGEPMAGYPDAPYWFVATSTTTDSGEAAVLETYAARTGRGLVIAEKDLAHAATPGPATWGHLTLDGVDTPMTWSQLYRLPTDPHQLGAVLTASAERSSVPGDGADREMAIVRELLDGSPASPALRQALWTVAAGLPRTTVTPDVGTSPSLKGTEVDHTALSGEVTSWLYDPSDGAVLQRWQTTPAAGITSQTTYLDQGPAYSLPR